MCDYSQYLNGDLKEYVLCQPDPEGNRLETCVIWHTPTGSVLTTVEDELYLRLKRWMLENGVQIVRTPPLSKEDRKRTEVDPQLIRDFEAQGGSVVADG